MRLLHFSWFTLSIGRRTTEICPRTIPSSSVRSTNGKWTLVESGFCLKLDKNYLVEYKVAEIGFSSGKWAFNLCVFTAIPVHYYYFSVTRYSQISQEVRNLHYICHSVHKCSRSRTWQEPLPVWLIHSMAIRYFHDLLFWGFFPSTSIQNFKTKK